MGKFTVVGKIFTTMPVTPTCYVKEKFSLRPLEVGDQHNHTIKVMWTVMVIVLLTFKHYDRD